MKNRIFAPVAALAISLALMSCDNDRTDSMPETHTLTVENVVTQKDFAQSGTFQGVGTPPLILPGASVEIKFSAGKGQTLAFATMYGASKDWFFAPANPGLKLYDDSGNPMTGDVSNQIKLWDNGSKDNMSGAAESKNIIEVPGVNASNLMKLNLAYNAATSEFTLTIKNTSGGTMNETPFSPGVWAVSNVFGGNLINKNPFFKEGMPTNAEIKPLAEMGNPANAAKKATENTGIITGLSPVIAVVYNGISNPLFKTGTTDMGNGLKELAQKGDATKLKTYLGTVKGVKKVVVLGNAPIAPGAKVSEMITAENGDKIAYATMFGYSNDWFYANGEEISAVANVDLTAKTMLYDNGTAKDQFPGAGNGQSIFSGMQTAESKSIEKVGNTFPVPAVNKVLKVTLK